jgi:hypothetical protein
LNFPFRAKHVGAAAALVLMIWAGYSYATRDPSKLSVYPVTGKVLLDGTAPEGAAVVLHPLDDSLTIRPRGVVGADGTFRLTTYLPSDGAPIGEYKLTVQWNKSVDVDGEPVPGPNLLPAELARPESTTFKVAVQSGKNELAPLEIRK